MGNRFRILVVGASGEVGLQLCRIIARFEHPAELILGGRSEQRLQALAEELKARICLLDVDVPDSLSLAVEKADIVVNCFIPVDRVNTTLAALVAEKGKVYLDVAAIPLEHLEQIKDLHKKAEQSGALLMTALGLNPGIVGMILKQHAGYADWKPSSSVRFTMGSDFSEISVLSLQGIARMMQVLPEYWNGESWTRPDQTSLRSPVGAPVNRKIYFAPAMITPDVRNLTKDHAFSEIRIWSGMESLWQTLVLLIAIRMGRLERMASARKLLKRLRRIGDKARFHAEVRLDVHSADKNGRSHETSLHAAEVYATALCPAIAVLQILEGRIDTCGAFYPTEVLDTEHFFGALGKLDIGFSERITAQPEEMS